MPQRTRAQLASAVCAVLLIAGCGGPRASAPGERREATPERAWAELRCANRAMPVAHLNTIMLIPGTVKPGEAFNHRMIYSLCTADGAPVRGRLRTRVLHGADTVLTDAVPGYTLKPGRWAVDATVKVPVGAPEGIYNVVVDFTGPVTFNRAIGLTVKR